MTEIFAATFYRFAKLDDYTSTQDFIETCCKENNVKGIVLLANEWINSTIAGSRDGVLEVLRF